MAKPAYRRVIVKVSGEALAGPDGFGIHQPTLDRIAADLVAAPRARRRDSASWSAAAISSAASQVSRAGVARPTADTMGMLATVMNALALEAAHRAHGRSGPHLSALAMPQVCETYDAPPRARPSRRGPRRRARRRHRQSVSSPPTRPRCCAPPKSTATPCSRPPRSTASIAPTRRRTPRPSATTG